MAMSKMAERSTYQAGDAVTITRQLGTFPIPLPKKLLPMYRKRAVSLFNRGSRPSCLNNLAMVKLRRRLWLQKASTPKKYVTGSNRPPALGEPTDAFLERAKEMIQSAFKKEPS